MPHTLLWGHVAQCSKLHIYLKFSPNQQSVLEIWLQVKGQVYIGARAGMMAGALILHKRFLWQLQMLHYTSPGQPIK